MRPRDEAFSLGLIHRDCRQGLEFIAGTAIVPALLYPVKGMVRRKHSAAKQVFNP
jgi:hypothetical protein